MNKLTLTDVKETFFRDPTKIMWVPTATRNEIIADEGFSSTPKFAQGGRIYRWNFKSIGGGMWEINLIR